MGVKNRNTSRSPERSVVHDKGPGERNKRRHHGYGEDGDLDNSALAIVDVVKLGSLTIPAAKKMEYIRK